MLIDIHFHPDYYKDEELAQLSCRDIVCVANSLSSKNHEKIINLSRNLGCYFALGLYPEFASFEELNILKQFLEKYDAIAIGEVGLDKTYDNFETQIEIFKEVIKLSKETGLPLIVHSRKAEDEVVELLSEANVKAILHYFNGKFKLAKKAYENGLWLTIPSNVVRQQHFQKIVKEIAVPNAFSRFLPETDAPFLHPLKQWPNYPENVKFAYDRISEEFNIPMPDLHMIFEENFKEFLGLKKI